MPKKLKLTSERKEMLKRNGKITGKPIRNNVSIESRYIAALTRLVNQMTAQTERELLRMLKQEGFGQAMDAKDPIVKAYPQTKALLNKMNKMFNSLFGRKAQELSDGMLASVTKESELRVEQSLKDLSGGLTFKMDNLEPKVQSAIKSAHLENIAKIKTIPDQYMARVEKVLLRSAGGNMEGMTEALQNITGMEKRQAKNIALDQTRKSFAEINRARMQTAGVNRYEWVHSGGGAKPREKHITPVESGGLNGGVYEYDDPPNAAEEGDEPYHANPSEMINCKCIAAPVIDFDDDEYADEDEESEQEEGEEDYAEDSVAQYRIPRTARRA